MEKFAHISGVCLSVIGIILSGLGVLGEERVKRWDAFVRDILSRESLESCLSSGIITVLLFIGGFASIIVYFLSYLTSPDRIPAAIGNIIFALMCGAPILALAIPALFTVIYILTTPYRVLDFFVSQQKMQSTSIVIGIICALLGFLLIELY